MASPVTNVSLPPALLQKQYTRAEAIYLEQGQVEHAIQMYRSILRVLGEGFPATKDLEIMRDRCWEAMIDASTELLIIDEAHEGGKGSAFGPSTTAELKTILNWYINFMKGGELNVKDESEAKTALIKLFSDRLGKTGKMGVGSFKEHLDKTGS